MGFMFSFGRIQQCYLCGLHVILRLVCEICCMGFMFSFGRIQQCCLCGLHVMLRLVCEI